MYKEVGRSHKLYFITDGKWRKCGDRIERNVKYLREKWKKLCNCVLCDDIVYRIERHCAIQVASASDEE